jgi:2-polyprenyl-3-methyl-5-hydroxy-6-metoxy-1,4-benzoquinol methylase
MRRKTQTFGLTCVRHDSEIIKDSAFRDATICDLCGGNEFDFLKHIPAAEWDGIFAYYRDHPAPNPFEGLPLYFSLQRCRECRLVCVTPRLKAAIVNRFYDEYLSGKFTGYLNDYIPAFRESIFHCYWKLIEKYLPAEATGPNRRHLDIGCATGEFLKLTAGKGYEGQGIEVSPEAASNAARYGRVIVGDVLAGLNQIEAATLNLATLVDSLEHCESPRSVLASLRVKLKPDALVFIETPNYDAGQDEMSRHFYLFTTATMKRLLRSTGFLPLMLEETGSPYNPGEQPAANRFITAIARPLDPGNRQ